MSKAKKQNITNRRTLLTMAAAVPAVIAGAPMATAALADRPAKAAFDPRVLLELLAEQDLTVNISTAAENDQYVVYSVRVPREASLDHDHLVALGDDAKFGADLAAWLAARVAAA